MCGLGHAFEGQQVALMDPGVLHSHPSVLGATDALQSRWPLWHVYMQELPVQVAVATVEEGAAEHEIPHAPQLEVVSVGPHPASIAASVPASGDPLAESPAASPPSLGASPASAAQLSSAGASAGDVPSNVASGPAASSEPSSPVASPARHESPVAPASALPSGPVFESSETDASQSGAHALSRI
jgi:hypothetical protein